MTEQIGARILVVEDDRHISEAIGMLLRQEGYAVSAAYTGHDGLRRFHSERPHLVVLDIGLPQMSGWEVLQRIREIGETPVLILTALGRERDKVKGLRAGADDYLTKPFGNSELAARVSALLRRAGGRPDEADVYRAGSLEIHFPSREVLLDGEPITLTPLEFRMLAIFIRNPRKAISIRQLLEQVWNDPTGIGPERVKFTVMRLRRKLGWTDPARSPIENVRGHGYRYMPARSASLTQ